MSNPVTKDVLWRREMTAIQQKTLPLTRAFGPLDIVIVLLVISACLAFIPFMRSGRPSVVAVRRDNTLVGRYQLSETRSFRLHGALGPMDIAIKENGVRVLHATCKNQICVHSGIIREPFQQIICVPNHITLEIESGNANSTVDAIVK